VTPLLILATPYKTNISHVVLKAIFDPQKYVKIHAPRSASREFTSAKPRLTGSELPLLQLPAVFGDKNNCEQARPLAFGAEEQDRQRQSAGRPDRGDALGLRHQ